MSHTVFPKPTLYQARSTRCEHQVWCLSANMSYNDRPYKEASLLLEIHFDWSVGLFGNSALKFFLENAAEHDPLEILTQEQFKERVQNTLEHEEGTKEEKEAFHSDRCYVLTKYDHSLRAQMEYMRRCWEAVQLICNPHVV